jgi:hypothetical protein
MTSEPLQTTSKRQRIEERDINMESKAQASMFDNTVKMVTHKPVCTVEVLLAHGKKEEHKKPRPSQDQRRPCYPKTP